MKRIMENLVMSRQSEGHEAFGKKLPVMRTLARLHECDLETIVRSVDASEPDVQDVLRRMLSDMEVEAPSGKASFTLTLKGWEEYMSALGSLYELPE